MKKLFALIALIALPLAAGDDLVPPRPASLWVPPPAIAKRYEAPTVAAATPFQGAATLPDILDYALANNPSTRQSWLEARAAAESLLSRQSAYLPTADLDATLSAGRSGSAKEATTTLTPSLSLNYLLFDFGGRAAAVRGAREALIAASYSHNASIQNLILRVEQAWFDYLSNKALLEAQSTIVAQFQRNLDAADARHKAGVATIADVLQARTVLAQAQLSAESIEGALHTVEGALATAAGLPPAATFSLDAAPLPIDLPLEAAEKDVQSLVDAALARRPELAASRADEARAAARVAEVRAAGLPEINVAATSGVPIGIGSDPVNHSSWSTALLFRFPFFTGFRNTHDIRAAELQRQIAHEETRRLEQSVNLQVWSAYYAMQTARQRVTTSRALLDSARQSSDVARARYREGLGTILDLLTAESALANATAQEISARADWLLAAAQLSHDIGALTPESASAVPAVRGPQ